MAKEKKEDLKKTIAPEQIVMDEAVIFPLYTQCNAEMMKSNVTGVEYHPVALNRVYKDTVKTAQYSSFSTRPHSTCCAAFLFVL